MLDRVGLIIEIFGQRARTREARLQVPSPFLPLLPALPPAAFREEAAARWCPPKRVRRVLGRLGPCWAPGTSFNHHHSLFSLCFLVNLCTVYCSGGAGSPGVPSDAAGADAGRRQRQEAGVWLRQRGRQRQASPSCVVSDGEASLH